MLTARTFAKEKGISYTTVMAWLKEGMIPGAKQQETPVGMVWQIPTASLDKVEARKRGPKKAESGSDSNQATFFVGTDLHICKDSSQVKKQGAKQGATKKRTAKKVKD